MIVLVQICVLLWDLKKKSKPEMILIRIKLLRSNLDKVLPVVAWLISGISVKSSYRKKKEHLSFSAHCLHCLLYFVVAVYSLFWPQLDASY